MTMKEVVPIEENAYMQKCILYSLKLSSHVGKTYLTKTIKLVCKVDVSLEMNQYTIIFFSMRANGHNLNVPENFFNVCRHICLI